ncbi:hypothetical protein NBE99_08315 [Thermosynechococcus sp. HN-54]|uniref:hypothetical protein n=1 Tax=Thermosynechococcus sp. HN-54 TaxID=2933959 RepID=UPI00202CDE77|nr:hypothetical protein [Thermosynechococcus sp. HN-54]URR34649.1 hypothetical protein NBE99_08315 [Thermosynechococcus sp. HN-54]
MNQSTWTALLLFPVLAQTPSLPQPNSNGDYITPTSHRTWVVVDPDINGLNCRWSDNVPQAWYAPNARWPNLEIMRWPVVRRFPTGTVLTANITPAGFATMTDSRGLPWLKVSIGAENRICLVRANRRFIRPR